MADISKISPDNGTTIYNLKDIEARKRVPEVLLKDTVGWTGKNLLKIPASVVTQTINGVTFTVNSDGSITANGTASAQTLFEVTKIYDAVEKCIFSGCPKSGSTTTYDLRMGGSPSDYIDYGEGVYIERNVPTTFLGVYIVIRSGQTVSNLTFYPMLRKSDILDSTYEPYHESVEQTLRDAEVIEGKNKFVWDVGIAQANTALSYSDKGEAIRVYTVSNATYRRAEWVEAVEPNTDYIISCGANVTSGTGAAQVRTSGGTTIVLSDRFTSSKNVELKFNSGVNTSVVIVLYCTWDTSEAGDITFNNVMLCTEEEWNKSHDFEPYYIPLKDSKFDRVEQRALGAYNLLNLNKDNVRIISGSNGYDLTANGIRVYNTKETDSYSFVAFWLKNLPKNTDIKLRFRVSITSGKGRILISNRTEPVVNVYERDFPENGEFTCRFNTEDYELLSINFYSSVEAAAGDVTYSYTILSIDSLISDLDNLENIYVPYAMTNKELTEELTEVIDGSSGITSTGTLDNDYLVLKRSGQEVFCQLRVNGTFAAGATLAVLPEGFRPKKRIAAAGNITSKGFAYVDISIYGLITCGSQAVSNENLTLLYTSWRID